MNLNNNYSPYADAAGAMQGIGGGMNQLVMGLAQQKYARDMRQQQLQVQLMNALSEQALRNATIEHYKSTNKEADSSAGYNDARAAVERGKLEAANRLGTLMQPQLPEAVLQGQDFSPDELQQNLAGSRMAAALQSGALSGDLPGMLFHNIPANNVAQNNVTGQPQSGMISANAGQTIFDNLGRMLAQGMINLPKGAADFQPTVTNGVPSYAPGPSNQADVSGEMATPDQLKLADMFSRIIDSARGYNVTNDPSLNLAQQQFPRLGSNLVQKAFNKQPTMKGTNSMQVGRFKVTPR